ncbi:MAG: pilus assembly protein PilM [Deltaproteobacteria bacterium]|nr:pilus assembly protein PilM [Deltaproteobacteria bacterium]MBI2501257.1 pilus assembly protein PilM [Deltaproteobacteria bacterium]
MRQRILGIDVGGYSIKVAEIERSFRTFELVGFYEQPILRGESGGGETGALQRLFEEYNLSTDFLYTALPGHLTALRLVELPFSNFKKVDTTIEFEMENYLPLPLEETVVDYQFVIQEKNSSKIMAAYARKGELIKFTNHFASAELDPRFVGAEAVEISNLLKLGVVVPEGSYAVVDIGYQKTNLYLFVSKTLYLTRSIMIGGRDLTHAVATTLTMSEPDAEKIKIEMGQLGPASETADAMTRQVAGALSKPLDDLLVQIKQTMLAFQQERGEVVQAVLLTGGSSRLRGIDQFFSQALRKNVSFLDCMDFAGNRLSDTGWCRPIAATSLSLAYRGVLGVGNKDLHFRRGEFAYRGEMKDLSSLIKEVAIQIGIITAFVLVTFLVSYLSLRGRIKEQETRIAKIAGEVLPDLPPKSLSNAKNVISVLAGRITEASEKKQKLDEETAISILDALKEVSEKLPAKDKIKVDIDDLMIASGRIKLTGRTDSFEAVDQIKGALSQSTAFQDVTTQNVRKGVGDEVKFDLSFELKIGEEEKDGA